MDVSVFDQVLRNPVWHKRPSPINPRQLIFEFEVSAEASILYTVDLDLQQVAANSVPRDLANFRPAVADWPTAWEMWFRPWCGDEDVIKFMNAVWKYQVDWLCDSRELSISVNYIDLGETGYEMLIKLTPEGKVKSSTTTIVFLSHVPSDEEPAARRRSVAELTEILENRME